MSKEHQLSLHGHGGNDEDYDRTASKYSHNEGDEETDEESDKHQQKGPYASGFVNKPGKRLPKSGYIAESEIRRAQFKARAFEAEAKGPNAAFGAEASLSKVEAMARAELISASAKAGPVGVKVGLGFDTGASVGLGGVEAKFLGTGISLGAKNSVSVLGSEVSCSVM